MPGNSCVKRIAFLGGLLLLSVSFDLHNIEDHPFTGSQSAKKSEAKVKVAKAEAASILHQLRFPQHGPTQERAKAETEKANAGSKKIHHPSYGPMRKKPKNETDFDLAIPGKIPLSTIEHGDFPSSVFGASTLDAFLGKWETIRKNDTLVRGNKTICPSFTKGKPSKFLCEHYHGFKEYVASSLRPFNASHFAKIIERRGPIIFVGDSLTGQMQDALSCLLEAETGSNGINVPIAQQPLIHLPANDSEYIEIRIPELAKDQKAYNNWLNPDFVQQAISRNASYVVFNTGAHWRKLRWRGDWCDWESWDAVENVYVVNAFDRVFRDVLFPIFQDLRAHGIVTIWRDISPGGLWDDSLGDIAPSDYTDFYHNFPVFNQIGRKYVAAAEGLILPIFDLSQSRWQDHVITDRTIKYTTKPDPLHWCSHHSKETVPSVWVRLLYNVIFDDLASPTKGSKKQVPQMASSRQRIAERSLQKNHSEHYNTVEHDLTKRKEKVVPYSKSNVSACLCSAAKSYVHCAANIGCAWLASGRCSERANA